MNVYKIKQQKFRHFPWVSIFSFLFFFVSFSTLSSIILIFLLKCINIRKKIPAIFSLLSFAITTCTFVTFDSRHFRWSFERHWVGSQCLERIVWILHTNQRWVIAGSKLQLSIVLNKIFNIRVRVRSPAVVLSRSMQFSSRKKMHLITGQTFDTSSSR